MTAHKALEGMGTSDLYFCLAIACCQQLFCFVVLSKQNKNKKKKSGLDIGFVFVSSSSRRVMILFEALSMHLFSYILMSSFDLMINEIFFHR